MIQEPIKWTKPLGSKADIVEIPEQSEQGSGVLSFNDIFPLLTQIPLMAGGKPVRRVDMNAVLKLLGDNVYFKQLSRMYSYDPERSYSAGNVVLFQNNLYRCIQDNGAPLQAQLPTNKDYWSEFADLSNFKDNANFAGIWVYNNTSDYIIGDIAYYQDNYYKCIKPNGISSVIKDCTDPNYWEIIRFVGKKSSYFLTPRITAPTNNEQDVITFTRFDFADVYSFVEALEIVGVQLEIASENDISFVNPTVYTSENLSTYTLNTELNEYSIYHARIKAVTNFSLSSPYSEIVTFKTGPKASIIAPSITCSSSDLTKVSLTPTFTLSNIQTSEGAPSDTLKQCDVWIENQAGEVVYTFAPSTSLSYTVPKSILQISTDYVVKATQTGNRFGTSPVGSLAFRTLTAYVAQPTITSPANNANLPLGHGITIQTSAFQVVNDTDTHYSTTWEIFRNGTAAGNLVISETSLTNKTSITITYEQLTNAGIVPNDTLYLRACHTGQTYGDSDFSPFVKVNIIRAYVNKPSITSPSNNATVAINANLVLRGSAFSVTNDTDTHKSSTWEVYNGGTSSGNLAISKNNSSTSVTITPTELANAGISENSTIYCRVKYTGTLYGDSEWSNFVTLKTVKPYVKKPSITTPTSGASISSGSSLLIQTTSFQVVNGTDTHKSTIWELYKNGTTNRVYNDNSTTNLVSKTITASQLSSAGFSAGDSIYMRVAQVGNYCGQSEFSDFVYVTMAYAPVVSLSASAIDVGGTVTATISGGKPNSAWSVSSSGATATCSPASGNLDSSGRATCTITHTGTTGGTSISLSFSFVDGASVSKSISINKPQEVAVYLCSKYLLKGTGSYVLQTNANSPSSTTGWASGGSDDNPNMLVCNNVVAQKSPYDVAHPYWNFIACYGLAGNKTVDFIATKSSCPYVNAPVINDNAKGFRAYFSDTTYVAIKLNSGYRGQDAQSLLQSYSSYMDNSSARYPNACDTYESDHVVLASYSNVVTTPTKFQNAVVIDGVVGKKL